MSELCTHESKRVGTQGRRGRERDGRTIPQEEINAISLKLLIKKGLVGLDSTNELDRNHQTRIVQVVPKSPFLFNATILENVKFSCPEASYEDALAAMKTANRDGLFVFNLDSGIHY